MRKEHCALLAVGAAHWKSPPSPSPAHHPWETGQSRSSHSGTAGPEILPWRSPMSAAADSPLHPQDSHLGPKSTPTSTHVSTKASDSISEQEISGRKAFTGHVTQFQIEKLLGGFCPFIQVSRRGSIMTRLCLPGAIMSPRAEAEMEGGVVWPGCTLSPVTSQHLCHNGRS